MSKFPSIFLSFCLEIKLPNYCSLAKQNNNENCNFYCFSCSFLNLCLRFLFDDFVLSRQDLSGLLVSIKFQT